MSSGSVSASRSEPRRQTWPGGRRAGVVALACLLASCATTHVPKDRDDAYAMAVRATQGGSPAVAAAAAFHYLKGATTDDPRYDRAERLIGESEEKLGLTYAASLRYLDIARARRDPTLVPGGGPRDHAHRDGRSPRRRHPGAGLHRLRRPPGPPRGRPALRGLRAGPRQRPGGPRRLGRPALRADPQDQQLLLAREVRAGGAPGGGPQARRRGEGVPGHPRGGWQDPPRRPRRQGPPEPGADLLRAEGLRQGAGPLPEDPQAGPQ